LAEQPKDGLQTELLQVPAPVQQFAEVVQLAPASEQLIPFGTTADVQAMKSCPPAQAT
jgi:hypothetical protein